MPKVLHHDSAPLLSLWCLPWSPTSTDFKTPHLLSKTHTSQATHRSPALPSTFQGLAKPFMDTHRPSSAGVRLPSPQTSTHRVSQCLLCACACVSRLTWRLASEPDTPHTIHIDVSLVHLFNLSFLSFLLFYIFDSPLPCMGSITWDANGQSHFVEIKLPMTQRQHDNFGDIVITQYTCIIQLFLY